MKRKVKIPETPIWFSTLWRDKKTNRRYWKCSKCGKCDLWQDGWKWFGSWQQADEEFCEEVLCPNCGINEETETY